MTCAAIWSHLPWSLGLSHFQKHFSLTRNTSPRKHGRVSFSIAICPNLGVFKEHIKILIINLDEIFVVWSAIFFLNTLFWWDDFVWKVFPSVRIEFKCVKTGFEPQESGRNVAFYGVNWNSGQISPLPPRGFNRLQIKKVDSRRLHYFSIWKGLVTLPFFDWRPFWTT